VYVVIAFRPTVSINPFPPLSPLPSPSTTTGPGTSSPIRLSPSPSSAARPAPTPTPLVPTTPTPTPAPTFPFTASVGLGPSDDCGWAGLVGEVEDREGEPLEGYPIHVWGPGLETIVLSGSAPAYGPSGWEVVITDTGGPISGTWFVQLHQYNVYHHHPPLSAIVRVELPGTCSESLVTIGFRERKAIGGSRE